LPKLEAEARMRALAKEFPGSLRELQGLPVDSIGARCAELARVQHAADAPAWAKIHMGYHRVMRCVLTAKRWFSSLGKDGYADPSTFATLASFEHDGETAALVAAALERVRAEPRGSRMALVLTAEALAMTEAEVRTALVRDLVHEAHREKRKATSTATQS
jgi:hypothetical protein